MQMLERAALFAAIVGLAATASTAARAQAYPTKPVRTIMTVAGGADIVARLVAQGLTEALGQPVVVEQQSGAGGAVGADMITRSAPDGYNIMLAAAANVVGRQFLVKNTSYDAVKSFTPIGKVADTVLIIITHPSQPFASMKDVVEFAKKNPGKISYGTSGVGTNHHLSAEVIRLMTGIDWVHVPYKGGPPVVTDTMTGLIQIGFSILATAQPFINSGKVKVIAVNNATRASMLPNIATVSEQLPGYDVPAGWMGYLGPAGMPQPIVHRLNTEIVRIMNTPEVKSKAEQIGFIASTNTPEQFADMIKRDLVSMEKVVKAAGIQPE
jgi:tripartite-type tricarboxylate transporter receptor subunit TctC